MQRRYQFLLAVVLLLIFFILGLWFQANRLLPSGKLHELLVQKVQALTEGTLKYQGVQVGYFPQPMVVFDHPQWTFPGRAITVEAEKMRFDFNILPLFLGRMEPAAFYVQSGKAEFSIPGLAFMNPVRLDNFSLQVGAVSPKIAIPFHFTSSMVGKPEVLVVKGNVVLDSVEQWNWEKASGSMVVELKQLSIPQDIPNSWRNAKQGLFFKGGQIDTTMEITKKPHEAFLELTATGSGKGLSYEVAQEKTWITPPALDAEWDVKAAWNNDTEEFKIHKAIVKLPFGGIETNGSMKFNTGEILGVHTVGSDMVLEDLLKYWPGFESILPFHIGFSGPGKWVLSAEGTADHLSLHFDLDLLRVLLSYGQYFTKPKDVPLDLNFDLLLQKGERLAGDFAVKFKDMSIKGNLKDLDLKNGEGQLNLITNKFSITGWEQYIPAMQSYKLDGEAKLLANWKGDLHKLEQAQHIFNLTFDKASWITADGKGIRNAALSLDDSPLMLEGRQMKFEAGGSAVVMDLKVSGFPEKPQAEMKLASKELKPLEAWESVTALLHHKTGTVGPDIYDHVKEFIQALCPAPRTLKNLSTEIHYENKTWNVPVLTFESCGGKADLKGALHFKDKEPVYHGEGEFRGLDLGSFLSRQKNAGQALDGTLALKGVLDGTGWGPEAWSRSLKGQGELTLSNGAFRTFDLKDVLSKIEHFRNLGAITPGMKDFDTMNFNWKIAAGKASTDNMLVKTKDHVIDGQGTLEFNGLANFRMEVFLASALASKLLPDMTKLFAKNPKAYLGPIPVLLSGSLAAPDVKLDPVQTEKFVWKIRKKKAKDIFVELVVD